MMSTTLGVELAVWGDQRSPLPCAAGRSTVAATDDSTVHIFWDHSNVFLSACDACDDRGKGFEPGHRWDARVDFPHLYDFAAAGRHVERAVAVGSIPPGLSHLWRRLERAGVQIELQERGSESGKEQAVDEALQLHMLRSVVDRGDKPAVAVLVSGDGGYYDDVQRMLDSGWGSRFCASAGACRDDCEASRMPPTVARSTSTLTVGTASSSISKGSGPCSGALILSI